MSIVDVIIIAILFLGAFVGLRRGLIKQSVLLVGLVASVVIAFCLRIPISTYFYTNLPFFNFGGIFKGVSILNILVYELIAFFIIFSVLILILKILLKITGLIEKILKVTIILGFFSRIGGSIVGFIEGYVIVFVFLFVVTQPFFNVSGLEESKFTSIILDKTPVLSTAVEDTRGVIYEIYDTAKDYKKSEEFNKKAIDLFLKYDIISEENLNLLKEKGKI